VVDTVETRERLRRDAVVIWLNADVEELARRVRSARHRPVASDPSPQLRQQLVTRSALFADAADIVVDAARRPSDIVDDLLVQLERR
jgi:shikimate kinase